LPFTLAASTVVRNKIKTVFMFINFCNY